jgi:Family of unknown function (DUF6065)
MADEQNFYAYRINNPPNMGLVKAPIERDWMDATSQRFAYRCLPLNIANQMGWFLTSPCSFELYWYGGSDKSDIQLRFLDIPDPSVTTHFGFGVLTFSLPYLFRTPPETNLWVKGPSNMPKDGIQALEGVIETDWAFSTFTMNWKVTRPGEWIRFSAGEPVCMVVPVPRGFAEHLAPITTPLTKNEELHAKYRAWEASRSNFLTGLNTKDPDAVKRGWQKDYFQGKQSEGGTFDGHQTKLEIQDFRFEE